MNLPRPDLVTAQEAFLTVMAQCYASTDEAESFNSLPGSHMTSLHHNGFRVVDLWTTTAHSDMSYGSTNISHDREPIWYMSYFGWYMPEVIPFLKRCLAMSYSEKKIFLGGRGPHTVNGPEFGFADLHYQNDTNGKFGSFNGREYIYRWNGVEGTPKTNCGFHCFGGHSLLDNIT